MLFNVKSTWGLLFLEPVIPYKWLLLSRVQTEKTKEKRGEERISRKGSLLIWFISRPHRWKLKWSQETCCLAATPVGPPRGKSKYKCRTRERRSFLGKRCLCWSTLVASCPSWGSLLLQWNSGSSSLFDLQLRGQCTRGSAQAVSTTLDESVETFLTLFLERLF